MFESKYIYKYTFQGTKSKHFLLNKEIKNSHLTAVISNESPQNIICHYVSCIIISKKLGWGKKN